MAIPSLLNRLLNWAMREEPAFSDDALSHPDLRQMSARDLADLPLGGSEAAPRPEEPHAVAIKTPQLSRCA